MPFQDWLAWALGSQGTTRSERLASEPAAKAAAEAPPGLPRAPLLL